MKYELEVRDGVSKKTGKPYTMFIVHAETDDGQFAAQGVASFDFSTKQAFDMLKVVENK